MAHKTPLYEEHLKLGGKMIDFAGWQLPLQFKGLRPEHERVRQRVGLFDVSHMGELRVQGPCALQTLQHVLCSPVERLKAGQAQYSLMLNEKGGVVDDLIVYCLKPQEDYLLCVNAINTQKNAQWLAQHNQGAHIVDESAKWAQIAIQGPQSLQLVEAVCAKAARLKPFECVEVGDCVWARTGYTGEKGVEVFVPSGQAVELWQKLLTLGQPLGAAPIGLAARDTLRIEMGYSLYGHEIDEQTLPRAAGLGWVLKNKEGDFVGRRVLEAVGAAPKGGAGLAIGAMPKKESVADGDAAGGAGTKASDLRLVGFVLDGPRVPRQGYQVFSIDKRLVGQVTSGTYSPVLGVGIGMAYVRDLRIGDACCVDFRGRFVEGRVVKRPFVRARVE